MILTTNLSNNSYDIIIEKGALSRLDSFIDLKRRVLIVTDDGVPKEYAHTVQKFCKYSVIHTLKQGEESKSFSNLEALCRIMLENRFDRSDAVVAIGGGVVGDLAGFAASCYMRGIDFYNIPTTVLSCVDSSVGGKTAVNFEGVKNIIGAFYQPKKVIIDSETLKTLPKRHISNGLAEALKMSMTFDKGLFTLFRESDPFENIEKIITMSLMIKAGVVSKDEKEKGLRKVLNFGHTIGHGIESVKGFEGGLYHGECVGLGMLIVSPPHIRKELVPILEKLSLPTKIDCDPNKVYEAVMHDKKSSNGGIDVVLCNEIGSFEIVNTPLEDIKKMIIGEFGK